VRSLLRVLIALWGCAFSAGAQEVYRFSVEVPVVYVDVFVTRDGKSVTGLTAENFEVFDSGVKQDVRLVDLESVPLSVLMVLDSSGSVWGEKLRNLRAGARRFIGGLREVDEAGLLAFSEEPQLLQAHTQDWVALRRAVNRLTPGGPTGLYDAVYTGLQLVEGRARPLIVLFTDGVDNASWLSASEVLEAAKFSEAVVHIIVVQSQAGIKLGIRENASGAMQLIFPHSPWPTGSGRRQDNPEDFLKDLAKDSGGKVWSATSSTGLEAVYVNILEEMGSRYLLTYEPSGVPGEGWHTLEVKLKKTKADDVRARSGYRVSAK
jgi:Ca-activated chloride channel family protein